MKKPIGRVFYKLVAIGHGAFFKLVFSRTCLAVPKIRPKDQRPCPWRIHLNRPRAPIGRLLLLPTGPTQPTDTELYDLLLQITLGKLPIIPSELAIEDLALGATPKPPWGPRTGAPSIATRKAFTKRIWKERAAVLWG